MKDIIRVLDKSRIKNEFIGMVNNKIIKKINKVLEKTLEFRRKST